MSSPSRYSSAGYVDTGVAPQDLPQEQLVMRNADLVKRIAYHLVSRMPPTVEVDDLIQAGMIGLLDAARHYTPAKGANFETYAGIRIRGAMLDEVRKSDWTPRSVHRGARLLADAMRKIENAKGQEARPAEVAESLNMTLDEYHKIVQDASSARLFSFEAVTGPDEDGSIADYVPDDGPSPLDELTEDGFRKSLAQAIEGLPDREKLVLSLYYDEEMNLREIGEVLEVSESRVCQIHGQALVRLRARLTEWVKN